MAILLKDRVKETTDVVGTGNATLLGAPPTFMPFSILGDGATTYYAIVDIEGGDWEVGLGTYETTGNYLARTTVLSNSAQTTTQIDFPVGVKDIFLTYPAEKAIYEEATGNVLIDGGPITVIGTGVTGFTTFDAALGEMYANEVAFAQFYAQNLNDANTASTDFVAYNDLGDGSTNFIDMGISSSNYSDPTYEIFTAGSGYLYNDGGELVIGTATAGKDVVLFAGGVAAANEAARIAAADLSVNTVADVNVGGDVNATGGTFTAAVTTTASMATPATTEFVTREYVDNATSNGFHVHTPVLVATTGNLTATYNQPGGAGDGVGATLTNSGTQVALEIDGVPMTVADRILVWQQTTGLQNGIYVVTTVGTGATNWVLTRSADANTSSEGDPNSLGGGDYFFVQSGDTLGYHSYICTNTSTITFGSTAITFNEFSSVPQYTGTAPINVSGSVIALTGTVAATNGGTGNSTVTTGDLLYGSGTNTWGKLAAGAGYRSLVMNAGGTQVEWNAVALNQSGAVSGSLPAANGGTGFNTYTLGDLIYSDATNSLAKLAGNTTTTKNFLVQTGTGSASSAPSWGTISGSDVSGTVSSATNVAGGAANKIVYQTGSGATAFIDAPVSSSTTLTWNGSAFTWASGGGATITNDTTTNTNYYPVWANATSGTMATAYVSSTKLTFNPGTGLLTATGFSGPLTGNVTGNVSGSSGSCTGNAATASSANALNSANNYSVTRLTATPNTSGVSTGITCVNGDMTAYRTGGTTGVIYLSSSGSNYLYWDGTNYNLNSGNLICTGNITAYSDETLKTNWRDLPEDFIAQLAGLKHGVYERIDSGDDQAGVSAQKLRDFLPQVVQTDEKGKLSVAYGNAAMVSAVQLAKRVVEQDERIARLEAIVAKLTQQGT